MADVRSCEQCGSLFEPRREHARFCSAHCRTAWNRDRFGDPALGRNALGWSVTAMRDTAGLLAGLAGGPRASAVIGEMVWWVTIVDATLVRHHPGVYDGVLAGQAPAQHSRVEGTLGGLRFVRNRLRGEAGCGDLIGPAPGGEDGLAVAWRWRPVPEPPLESLPPRARVWEMSRHQAYQAHLAGRAADETFQVATAFLEAAAEAACVGSPGTSAPARPRNRRYDAPRLRHGSG